MDKPKWQDVLIIYFWKPGNFMAEIQGCHALLCAVNFFSKFSMSAQERYNGRLWEKGSAYCYISH